jgi:hypothetical protein
MSNDVFLAGGNDPGPARRLGPDWTYSYDYGTEALAGCSYRIPVLWLFCFDAGSLITYDASDLCGSPWTVPSAVIETDRAGRLLVEREPQLDRWPGAGAYWGELAELIRDSGFRYLKLDLCELDSMSEEGITDQLTRALRWFDTDSGRDLAGFDALACFDRADPDASTLARGFRCGREVPWPPGSETDPDRHRGPPCHRPGRETR